MKAATSACLALGAMILSAFGCGGSPNSIGALSQGETELLREAGGALARNLAYPPGHSRWSEAPSDSVGRLISELGSRNPSAWAVLYRAASDTLVILESPFAAAAPPEGIQTLPGTGGGSGRR